MSYGSVGLEQSRLSAFHVEFLSVHPYFNPNIPIQEGVPPTIEFISPSKYSAGSESVAVQVALSDSDGLHQVFLIDERTSLFCGATRFGVWGCRGLAGEKDATITFNYDGGSEAYLSDRDKHVIGLEAVDIDGNVNHNVLVLEVDNPSEQPGVQKLVKISGDNQQGAINTQLALPFVVELRDEYGNPLTGEPVIYDITVGEGRLSGRNSFERATTDANGRIGRTLTLGPNPGINVVIVRSPRSSGSAPVQFSASAIGAAKVPISDGDYRTWHLPDSTIHRFGKGYLGRSDRIVEFSPDGQSLAVASSIGVWLYDVATFRELALLPSDGVVNAISFSRDGTTLASGSSAGKIKLWDVAKGEIIATLSGPPGAGALYIIGSVSISPDGRTLASASTLDTINLWDLETGFHVATLAEGRTRGFFVDNSVLFSPNGSILASSSFSPDGGSVNLWDVATRTQFAALSGHKGSVQLCGIFTRRKNTRLRGRR